MTNLDKVLFPARGDEPPVTKRDLIGYFARIAPTVLPYLAERPVNVLRHPDGVDRPGFWQKKVPSHAPAWLTRWRYPDADPGETEWYVVADSGPSLAWLANYGVVELHPWTSTVSDPHQPTWALIDIDPGPETAFEDVLVLARLHRTALEHLGVVGRPRVSGRRGIQISIPLAEGYTFDQTRAWVETLSRAVGATVPELVSWSWHKDNRRGLARLDYTQNAINRTLVAPYSTRAAPGAPVSVPLSGTSSTIRTCGRTAGRSGRCWIASRHRGPVPRPPRRGATPAGALTPDGIGRGRPRSSGSASLRASVVGVRAGQSSRAAEAGGNLGPLRVGPLEAGARRGLGPPRPLERRRRGLHLGLGVVHRRLGLVDDGVGLRESFGGLGPPSLQQLGRSPRLPLGPLVDALDLRWRRLRGRGLAGGRGGGCAGRSGRRSAGPRRERPTSTGPPARR